MSAGTVLFGLNYDLSNTAGQITEDSAPDILISTATQGSAVLDTASLYSESEAVFGRLFNLILPFCNVTKTSALVDTTIERAQVSELN